MDEFEGWLIKVNGTDLTDWIHAGSYKATPDQQTDIDDYTDNDGIFHRNVLPAKATKIEFNIKPMHLAEKRKLQQIIPNRTEVLIEYWNDETNSYKAGKTYVPDITYSPHIVYRGKRSDMLYDPIRIAFIENGEVR